MMVYNRLQAVAERLIDKYGGDVEYVDTVISNVDPVEDTQDEAETRAIVKGVLTQIVDKSIWPTSIKAGDQNILVAGTSLPTLRREATFVVNGEEWRIVEVEPLMPDTSTKLLYICLVRH